MVSIISANVAPLARFINAMTLAFLFARLSLPAVAPFCVGVRFTGLTGDFFDSGFVGATSLASGAPSGGKRWIAAQIHATAFLRSVNADDSGLNSGWSGALGFLDRTVPIWGAAGCLDTFLAELDQ